MSHSHLTAPQASFAIILSGFLTSVIAWEQLMGLIKLLLFLKMLCLAINRKGQVSQNVLAACTFDLCFCYVLSGWEGSAADSHIYDDARCRDFLTPPNKYYLADAGFGICDGLLTPYQQVCYHLKEWSRGNQRYAFSYIFYLFSLYIIHADLKMHKNFSICGMQWQEMR